MDKNQAIKNLDDIMTKNKVFITSTSSISCAGDNNTELFNNIINSKSGITIETDFYYNSKPVL